MSADQQPSSATSPLATKERLIRYGGRRPTALHQRRQNPRTSRPEPPAGDPSRNRSTCSGEQLHPAYQPSHEWRLEAQTMDAKNKVAPETRSCGRFEAPLYNTIRPHSALGNLPPTAYANRLSVPTMQWDGTLRSLTGSAPRPIASSEPTGSNGERVLLISG